MSIKDKDKSFFAKKVALIERLVSNTKSTQYNERVKLAELKDKESEFDEDYV